MRRCSVCALQETLDAASIRLLVALVVAAAGCANQPFLSSLAPGGGTNATLGAADDGEGHEPDFDLGHVDDMREALSAALTAACWALMRICG